MTRLHDALDLCLKEIEQGADVDTVLFRHPEFADELRPILEASVKARAMAAPDPSAETLRRNRARLLQHASELRERRAVPVPFARRRWSAPLRNLLASALALAVLFLSSTGLVRASTGTLPGDNLYPVKLTWENVQLWFTFDPTARETLELEREGERLDEVNELVARGRSVDVEFGGYVTRQSGDEWLVSGIPVFLSSQTRLPDQPVQVGDAVRVRGQVVSGGVAALRIDLRSSGANPPPSQNENSPQDEQAENSNEQIEQETDSGSENEAVGPGTPAVPISTAKPEKQTLEGVATSIQDKLIVVNGVIMDIKSAEVKGTPGIGAIVKAEGFFDASGVFLVTKIEFRGIVPTAAPGANGNDDPSSPTDDNTNSGGGDDNTNNDDNTNDNTNDNDDNGGGGGGGGGGNEND